MKLGVKKPEKEFEKLLKQAIKGDARAQLLVGDRYHRGYGVVQDVDAAIMWYRKSALQEYPGALNMLGICYDTGDGVKQNQTEALKWYCKAVEHEYAPAQFALGHCFLYGRGVKRDIERGLMLMKMASY